MLLESRPIHGGRLRTAAAAYGIAPEEWLDLSTGINPVPWPVPPLDPKSWSRLPETEDGLTEAARAYYGAARLLPVAGSQAAIQALPLLRQPVRAGILSPAYAEHAHGWIRAGHEVIPLTPDEIDAALPELQALVLVNPNNPTGQRFGPKQLLRWHRQLAGRGGWLVVDEAFMDATPTESLASETGLPGLIVLRSLGKFFGLAGARVGFVLAEADLLAKLSDLLGPWTVGGPAREVAKRALIDVEWQTITRCRLRSASERLAHLLEANGLTPSGGTSLFRWVRTNKAKSIQNAFSCCGILVRCFEEPASLRFGLPGREREWDRLKQALIDIRKKKSLCE